MKKVAMFTPAWLDACALFRMFLPHCYIENSRFVFNPQGTSVNEYAGVDVIVVQRQATAQNKLALTKFKDLGFKLVYDLDDNMWNLPASNPAARILATMREGFYDCAHMCDLLTVSTPGLKSAVKTVMPKLPAEIVVVPNAIDKNLFHVSERVEKNDDKFVVGWGGSNTHAGDIREAWEILPGLLEELPKLHLEFIGHGPPKSIEDHPRVKIRNFVPVAEYFARYTSWNWDVVLAPLDDNRFNRSKSNIKMLEASMMGSVCLGSPVAPYIEFTDHNPVLKYLLCKNRDAWRQKIIELYHNRDLYSGLVSAMRLVTNEHYSIQKVKDQWESALMSVL